MIVNMLYLIKFIGLDLVDIMKYSVQNNMELTYGNSLIKIYLASISSFWLVVIRKKNSVIFMGIFGFSVITFGNF